MLRTLFQDFCVLALQVFMGLFLLAAPVSQANAQAEIFTVVTTTAQVADITRAVAGRHAQVLSLMGEGIDPHLYVLTRTDTATLLEADLVLYNGNNLEGKVQATFDRIRSTNIPVIAVTERLETTRLIAVTDEDDGDHYDPHVWFDPTLWADVAAEVAVVLAEQLPAHATDFQANADAYQQSLRSLHAYAQGVFADIPEQSRVLITAHDAFGYFGRAYNMDVMGIQGISTESEAGLKRIEEIVDVLVERNVPAVFVEASVTDRNIKALIEGAAQRGHTVTIGGKVYSDSMGEAGTYQGTYIGMLDHNISVIGNALGATVSPEGFQGAVN